MTTIHRLLYLILTISILYSCRYSNNEIVEFEIQLNDKILKKTSQIIFNDERDLFLVVDHSTNLSLIDLYLYKFENNICKGNKKINSEVDSVISNKFFLSSNVENKLTLIFDKKYFLINKISDTYGENITFGNFLISKITLFDKNKLQLIGKKSKNKFACLMNSDAIEFTITDTIIEKLENFRINFNSNKISIRKYDKKKRIIYDEIYIVRNSKILNDLYYQIIKLNKR
jgi:hypothetical protein